MKAKTSAKRSSKTSAKRLLSMASIVGIMLSSTIVFFLLVIFNLPTQGSYIKPALAASGQLPQESTPGIVSSKQVNFGSPVRLEIPKINVDAAVEYVGLTSAGAMDVPKGPSNVAWFELGTHPGDNGSAVIAGHYGRWKNGDGSVFDDLNKLSEGDRLYVEDDQGVVATFVVRASRIYDPKADAKDVFGSNDGKSHLNLIACDGVWNKVSKSYSERLVIFTDKVDSTSSPQE